MAAVFGWKWTMHVLGSTVVSPYVGMARKQNGGYNASSCPESRNPIVHISQDSCFTLQQSSNSW